jgi:hypothetical protein
MRIVAAVLTLVIATLPAAAQSDNPAPKAKSAAKAKRTPPPKAPRDSGLPLAERIAIQFDLAWVTEYSGLFDGEFNDKTTAAIKQFQHDRNFRQSGVLAAQERTALAAAAKARQERVGWVMLDDPATGARLGIPTRHVPNRSAGPSGTKWSSAQGQIQVETFHTREPGTTLAGVYEQQRKVPNRRLSLNLSRPDVFLLSGMQNLKRFYVRGEFQDGEVRGVTVLYDQATEGIMDPAAAAMAGSFTGFPGVGPSPFGGPARRKVEYGSGILVSAAGHVLTDRQLTEGCNVIVVAGHGDADRGAEDAGLALLRVGGAGGRTPAALTAEPVAEVTLAGIAEPQAQDGGSAVSTVAGKLKGSEIEPAPPPGFSGGAALDAAGRVAGMIQFRQVGNAATAPASLVPSAAIRAFLAAHKLDPPAGRAGLDAAKAALVRVICVRR